LAPDSRINNFTVPSLRQNYPSGITDWLRFGVP